LNSNWLVPLLLFDFGWLKTWVIGYLLIESLPEVSPSGANIDTGVTRCGQGWPNLTQ
jgi:hypothetical protein